MRWWEMFRVPKPEDNPYFKNGKLTDKGQEFVSRYLEDQIIKSFGTPQWNSYTTGGFVSPSPRPYNARDMVHFALQGCMYGSFTRVQSPTGRMHVNHPLPQSAGKNAVTSKIPTTGMPGFSESGQPDEWDLSIGEITGYRWWKIRVPARFAGYLSAPDMPLEGIKLIGQNNHVWEPGRIEAKCTASRRVPMVTWDDLLEGREPVPPPEHEPPEIRVSCGCGFWAYFNPNEDCANHFSNLTGDKPNRTHSAVVELPILGVIKGNGRVIVGERGFRSQYAEVAGLCIPDFVATQLSWFTTSRENVGVNRHLDSIRSTTFYRAAMGAPGWYYDEDVVPTETTRVPNGELLTRLSALEAALGDTYPDARIFSSQRALAGYFPPDASYRG